MIPRLAARKQIQQKLQEKLNMVLEVSSFQPLKGDTAKCLICGRKVHTLNNGDGPLLCCGQAMVKDTILGGSTNVT